MTVGQNQELFAECLAKLINEAHRLGYRWRLRELGRTKEMAFWYSTHCARMVKLDGDTKKTRCEMEPKHKWHHAPDKDHSFKPIGNAKSLHILFLAIDGYLKSVATGKVVWSRKHYEPLGKFWEALHPLCSWGGRFGDEGHFSIRHGGMR